ncbi:MAG: hypothetical protein ACM3O4_02475 [Ignavibacteriales bacterium]
MTNTELFNLMSKPWANVTDIKMIASCGRDNAIVIRNTIRNDIIKSGKKLPIAKEIIVPMKCVIEYLDFNIDYIAEMARNEKLIKT